MRSTDHLMGSCVGLMNVAFNGQKSHFCFFLMSHSYFTTSVWLIMGVGADFMTLILRCLMTSSEAGGDKQVHK